jgi:hypothetical protein
MERHAAPYRYMSVLQWVATSMKLHTTPPGSRNSSTVAVLGSRGRASVSLGARRPTTAGRCLADPCSALLAPQVVVPGGRGPEPPEAGGYEPPPQDATPRSAFRIVSGDAP